RSISAYANPKEASALRLSKIGSHCPLQILDFTANYHEIQRRPRVLGSAFVSRTYLPFAPWRMKIRFVTGLWPCPGSSPVHRASSKSRRDAFGLSSFPYRFRASSSLHQI